MYSIYYYIYILVWTANLSPREFYCFFASQLVFFSEDFSDFEDTRPEMNNLGFLKADGQHLGFAPVTDGGWYVGSAEHCIFLWCWYGYLMIIWMMMFYMQYIYIYFNVLFIWWLYHISPQRISHRKCGSLGALLGPPFLGLFSMFGGMC